MSLFSTLQKSYEEFHEIMITSNCINGDTLEESIENFEEPAFYEVKIKKTSNSSVPVYIVYNIDMDPISSGDDKVSNRKVYIHISIYSRLSNYSKKILDLIESIEKNAVEKRWNFEFEEENDYMWETKQYIFKFCLEKIL